MLSEQRLSLHIFFHPSLACPQPTPSTFELSSCPQQHCGSNPQAFLLPVPQLSKIQLRPVWAPADLTGTLPSPSCTGNAVPEPRSLQMLPSCVPQSLVPICGSCPAPGVTLPGRGTEQGQQPCKTPNSTHPILLPLISSPRAVTASSSCTWMGKGWLLVKRQSLGETFLFCRVHLQCLHSCGPVAFNSLAQQARKTLPNELPC